MDLRIIITLPYIALKCKYCLFTKFVVCFLLFIATTSANDLIFRNTVTGKNVNIAEDGTLTTNTWVKDKVGTINPASGDFVIRNITEGSTIVSVTELKTNIKETLRKYNTTKARVSDLSFYSGTQSDEYVEPLIVHGTDTHLYGDVSIKGQKFDNMVPILADYYVDDGVYEQRSSGVNPVYAYEDIISPVSGLEGRTEYTNNLPTASYFYVKDHLGSTRMTIDENGLLVEQNNYLAYGNQIVVRPGPEEATKEGFSGKEFDTEGNGVDGIRLNYFGRRYYDPEVGTFTSTDPAEVFWNSYSYCGGDPVNYIDPDGSNPIIGFWIGAAFGAATGALIGGVTEHNRGGDAGDIATAALLGGTIGFIVGGAAGYGIGSAIVSNSFQVGSSTSNIILSGTKTYTTKANNAFQWIWKLGLAGRNLIRTLERSDKPIKIKDGIDNNTDPFNWDALLDDKKPMGSTITWNPDEWKGKTDDIGSDQRNPEVGLMHELGHAEEMSKGESGEIGVNDSKTGLPTRENKAIKWENKLRKILIKKGFPMGLIK
jgi:RHS repeat-associated protein